MKITENLAITIEEHVLRTLAYYDIFNYPLTAQEVYRFLGTNHVDETYVTNTLNHLRGTGKVFHFEDLYTIQNNSDIITRRRRGNAMAEGMRNLAFKQGRLIASFPFVRGVFGSGSFSKNYMDNSSDLDFFIVTTPGRLWVARMLLVVYKRVFLQNSSKFFCVNYFVDEQHLEIEEKNLFTATELATTIPLYGKEYYHLLLRYNEWMLRYFPHFEPRLVEDVPEHHASFLKRMLETALTMAGGHYWNKLFKWMTISRWRKMYANHYSQSDFEVAFKSKDHTSKGHPKHYQQRVKDLYDKKLQALSLHSYGF